jgi:RNA polymerase sigma-70 factor (ECF subfamily)
VTTDAEARADFFQAQRPHLTAVAYRMLGSLAEADDAVQEAWIRLDRTDVADVENLAGWLTTVTARVCMDILRARRNRREESLEVHETDAPDDDHAADPELAAEVADSVGLALLVVMDTLAPAERLAFVLHDMFAVPFEDIAPIVGKSTAAARQLASRARRRVQGAAEETTEAGRARQREIVEAFLTAARGGDFAGLLRLLDPDVILRSDESAAGIGSARELRGSADVAENFSGRAQAARLALVDGGAGLVWAPGGTPKVVFAFTVRRGVVAAIEILADRAMLAELEIEILGDAQGE